METNRHDDSGDRRDGKGGKRAIVRNNFFNQNDLAVLPVIRALHG